MRTAIHLIADAGATAFLIGAPGTAVPGGLIERRRAERNGGAACQARLTGFIDRNAGHGRVQMSGQPTGTALS